MIVQQIIIIYTHQMINVLLSLEEQFWVTFLLWGSIIQSLLIAEHVFKISLAVAVKYLMMILQLRYINYHFCIINCLWTMHAVYS